MENNTAYHIPVLFNECIEGLNIKPNGVYVDVTFGVGGHARAIFEQLSPSGQLVVFDQDPDARNNAWEEPKYDQRYQEQPAWHLDETTCRTFGFWV